MKVSILTLVCFYFFFLPKKKHILHYLEYECMKTITNTQNRKQKEIIQIGSWNLFQK